MTTNKIYLLSGGDDIRFWQENESNALIRLDTVTGNVASLDWSESGFQLAACSSQENQPVSIIHISHDVKNGPSISTNTLSQISGHATVAKFANEQNYPLLGVGYNDGKTAIVNSRTLEINKILQGEGKHGIMSLCFDPHNTRLAASEETGKILVYNVAQAIHGKPLVQTDGAIVRQVKFSPHKKGVLASGSDSGSITMWDVFKSAKTFCFSKTHSMPVTGLSFSPLNDMLLLSAGLDKQFCCLDLRKNQVVKTVHTDGPVSSLDYHCDGFIVGVGTTRGRILIYDLRQSSRPVKEIVAHQTSVQSLKFANKSCAVTANHLKTKVSSPVIQKLGKPSASLSAISPLSANENTLHSASRMPGDPLASFYMRPDSAARFGDIELNHKQRILEAQRQLNQTPLISTPSCNIQTADSENIYRSQSVDILASSRFRMDETFRVNATEARNLSPVSVREGGGFLRTDLAGNRPFPSAASTPFQFPAPKSQAASISSISTLPSRIPADSYRPDSASSFVSALSHSVANLPVATEDSWSPSPEPPALSTTLKGNNCTTHTQTLVIGDFPLSQADTATQTEDDVSSDTLCDVVNLIDQRLDPIDENVRRLGARFISLMCDQTSELTKLMQEQLSPNVELKAEIDRLRGENEQLRQTVAAYDAKLFNSTLRL